MHRERIDRHKVAACFFEADINQSLFEIRSILPLLSALFFGHLVGQEYGSILHPAIKQSRKRGCRNEERIKETTGTKHI